MKSISVDNILSNKTIKNYYATFKNSKFKRNKLFEECINTVFNYTGKRLLVSTQNPMYLYSYRGIYTEPCVDMNRGRIIDKSQDPGLMLDLYYFIDDINKIYSDGSLIVDAPSVGAACLDDQGKVISMKSLHPDSSIFTAELTAILEALDAISNSVSTRHVIFTDSLSSLQAISSIRSDTLNHALIVKIKAKIHKVTNSSLVLNHLQLVWIPAHRGISCNELVDSVAKAATSRSSDDKSKIPAPDFKKIWEEISYDNTVRLNLKQGEYKGIRYFQEFYTGSKKVWFKNQKLDLKTIVTFNGLRANHYSSAASLARKNIVSSAHCKCGHMLEDLDHILFQCPIYERQKHKLFVIYQGYNFNCHYNSVDILKSLDPRIIKSTMNYLDECKINL